MEIRVNVARTERKDVMARGGSSSDKQHHFMPSYYNVFPAQPEEEVGHPSGDSHVSRQQRRDLLAADLLGQGRNPARRNTGCCPSCVVGCIFPPGVGPAVGDVAADLGGGCMSLPNIGRAMRQRLVGAAAGERWGSRG